MKCLSLRATWLLSADNHAPLDVSKLIASRDAAHIMPLVIREPCLIFLQSTIGTQSKQDSDDK
jgi:hypothetical protein